MFFKLKKSSLNEKEMGIHGLNDLPTIYQQEKTVIRKGVIHKQKIWKDTNGNELEKISDNPPKFAIKRNPKHATYDSPNFLRDLFFQQPQLQPQQVIRQEFEEDNYYDIIMLFTIFFLIFTVFIAGYTLGVGVSARNNNVTNPPACTQSVPEKQTVLQSTDVSTWT